jgi:nucleotide-binding universal stress UspA family protein
MLRTILAALDGSPCSETAVEWGIRWAKRFDALLVGIGVVDEPEICAPQMAPVGGFAFKEHRDKVVMNRARREIEGILESFALRCAGAGVSAKVLEDEGDPYTQILREAQRYDLILMGQETHFHFATTNRPCDTLRKVLKDMPRPVVMVPKALPEGNGIVVAYDGSLLATRALQVFASMAPNGPGTIHVVTIGKEHDEAITHAERAMDFLHNQEIKAVRHVLASSRVPAEVLAEQARLLGAGLIVMGAYGKPFLREFFLGSVTRTLLERSEVPLFLYH